MTILLNGAAIYCFDQSIHFSVFVCVHFRSVDFKLCQLPDSVGLCRVAEGRDQMHQSLFALPTRDTDVPTVQCAVLVPSAPLAEHRCSQAVSITRVSCCWPVLLLAG